MRGKGNSKVGLLRNVSLFSACNDKELKKIASLADELTVPAGSILTKEGEPGSEFFVIVKGKASVRIRKRKVAGLGPGSFIGEMSLLDRGPRVATVVADTPLDLLVLDARQFSSMLNQVPYIAKKLLVGMAERLRDLESSHSH